MEFVSDYQIQGLQNHYHTYGLGVPLIAVRKSHQTQDPAEHYYPPNVCFPITAFLRVERPNRLAYRGRRDAELGSGSAKTRVPRDREEFRQTAETVAARHESPGRIG